MANLFLNRQCEKVFPFNIALGNSSGRVEFNLSRARNCGDFEKRNTGASSVEFIRDRHTVGSSVSVAQRRLDDLVDYEGQNLALKIDVEGYEETVLRGMEMLLRRNNCAISIEIWSDRTDRVDAFLRSLNYHCREFRGGDNFLYVRKK